jgi:predicted phosphodiesterase
MLLVVLASSGCLRPAQPWAEADEAVGTANVGDLKVEVAEGLAAVHHIDAAGAVLWLTAPEIELDLSGLSATEPFTLTLRNALADAAPESVDGAPLGALTRTRPTEATLVLPAGPSARHLRWAVPGGQAPGVWRFGVLSDVQERLGEVDAIFALMALDPTLRFVVSAGDLTQRGTAETLRQFQTAMAAELPVPLYATPGNHERGTDEGTYQRVFGRASANFRFGGVNFLMVDSGSATIDPMVYGWLEGWLDRGADRVQVFVSHVAPFDPIGARSGSFRSRREAAKLVALLGRHGVDVALHGHVHSYYAYSAGGVPTYISGGGGAIPERLDGIERHYLTVDVNEDRIAGVALVRVD